MTLEVESNFSPKKLFANMVTNKSNIVFPAFPKSTVATTAQSLLHTAPRPKNSFSHKKEFFKYDAMATMAQSLLPCRLQTKYFMCRMKTRKQRKQRAYEHHEQSIYDWMINGSKRDQMNKHRMNVILERDEYCYCNPDARQLGVGYSSNNAGDGPQTKSYEILDIDFIYELQALFDLRDGDVIESDDFYILFMSHPVPRFVIQIYNGKDLEDLQTYLFGDNKMLQSTDYRPYIVCFSWLTIILDNLDDIKKRIGDADVYANIERIMYFTYDMLKAKDMSEVSFAIGRAVTTMMDGKLTRKFAECISNAIKIIFDMDLQSNDDDNIFQKIRHVLDNYVMLKDSPLVKKLHKFVMYILTFFLFFFFFFAYGSLGYTNLEIELL